MFGSFSHVRYMWAQMPYILYIIHIIFRKHWNAWKYFSKKSFEANLEWDESPNCFCSFLLFIINDTSVKNTVLIIIFITIIFRIFVFVFTWKNAVILACSLSQSWNQFSWKRMFFGKLTFLDKDLLYRELLVIDKDSVFSHKLCVRRLRHVFVQFRF